MTIVEIKTLENGAHRNQTGGVSDVPVGWALIREDVSALKNFPFGEVIAEEVNGVMTMTEWKPGEMPEPEPEPEAEPTAEELIDIMLGVTSDE